jgi:hypothetical protein
MAEAEPTEEEVRNGWTAETLTAYLQEQRAAQLLRIDPLSPVNRRAGTAEVFQPLLVPAR